MYRRDYLKKQMDEMAQVLAVLLSDLLEQKNEGRINEVIAVTDQKLKEELGMDLSELAASSADVLMQACEAKKISSESLDALANVLLVVADKTVEQNSTTYQLYEKCLYIYEHLERTEPVFSLDRRLKLERIRTALKYRK